MTEDRKTVDPKPDAHRLMEYSAAEVFYDARFRQGYMESWPTEKCARVAGLLQELPLSSKGRALDFGCGTGVFTAVLKTILKDWEVDGADISSNALEIARAKMPDCTFHRLIDCENMFGQFDLIFTHHVLEHVSNLPRTAEMLAKLLKPSGAMLHILPCADPGSLEYEVCMLRKDGIIGDPETRFFFEEEGHLRRLSTQGLVDLWSATNLRLGRAYYANQRFGGLKFLTGNGLRFILDFADPKVAVSGSAARRLRLLRIALIMLWFLRKPADVVRNKTRFGLHGLRDYFVCTVGIMGYPISKVTDFIVKKLANREWSKCRQTPGGSEMYVFLTSKQE
jgi:SAM-dependent methyltransferase